jgi:hypothetical protein
VSDGDALLDGTQAITAAMGEVGSATAVVQLIALAEMVRAAPGARGALGLHASAPQLASAVRVGVTR